MCIGEGVDTLGLREQILLRTAAAEGMPNHSFFICQGEGDLAWAVMAPLSSDDAALRFTICRIDPGVMVLVEDRNARRQFCSVANVEDAMAFIQIASEQAILASMHAHPAPETMQ